MDNAAAAADDDDCHSNKSLDLNFGKKLIDFKLSASSGPAQEEQAPQPAPSSSSESQEKEKGASSSSSSSLSGSPALKQQPEYKHVCRVCRKSFRYATTLARHERAHLSEETPQEENSPGKEESTEGDAGQPAEEKEELEDAGGESEGGESGESEEEEDEEEEEEEDGWKERSLGCDAGGRRVGWDRGGGRGRDGWWSARFGWEGFR